MTLRRPNELSLASTTDCFGVESGYVRGAYIALCSCGCAEGTTEARSRDQDTAEQEARASEAVAGAGYRIETAQQFS